ncbi:hypothetical protein [Paeniglutamicibacter kerguelensis]|uniref:Uncharacterized protein n=1 Tax=Paeniglutamicibacter kerguelensis TaxID=254788 RepID=A0ABS4XBH1_9MICC|nr:hypothetical protein [Paeniglutamicibacter kerguelensis]MBP2385806.1 hypothetical protein [Paeniglutamicibacter kerguelensis]
MYPRPPGWDSHHSSTTASVATHVAGVDVALTMTMKNVARSHVLRTVVFRSIL